MPKHIYDVKIDGHSYEVGSDTELSDGQAYQAALQEHQKPAPPSLWERANTPLADLRGSPTVRMATEQFAKDHPILGGGLNTLADTISSLSSPATLGLAAASGGSGLAEKLGASGLARVLRLPGTAASAGMVAHGGLKVAQAKTIPEGLAGGFDAGLGAGALGLSRPAATAFGNTLASVGKREWPLRFLGAQIRGRKWRSTGDAAEPVLKIETGYRRGKTH